MSNTQPADDYDSSSSSEDDGKFGFWGAGGGSSGRLSEYMSKREKESKKDMLKDIAAKREADLAKEKAEAAKLELAKLEAAKLEAAKLELARLELAKAEAAKVITSENRLASSNSTQSLAEILSNRNSTVNLSKDQVNSDNNAAITTAMTALLTQAMGGSTSHRAAPRDEFNTDPELLDSITASKVLRRLGAYRNWSEQEIQADLNALEFHRLRTVKDLRELSFESWKEIKELLPLVKELLIKEIHRGRTLCSAPLSNSMADAGFSTPSDSTKNVRAPTSTPMDSPDLGQSRRAFQGRQW